MKVQDEHAYSRAQELFEEVREGSAAYVLNGCTTQYQG